MHLFFSPVSVVVELIVISLIFNICKLQNIPSTREYYTEKYHCTIDLLFDCFGISCMITDNFCCYLQNRLIQTSQTGGQWYSDTSPFSITCLNPCCHLAVEAGRRIILFSTTIDKLD
jgi:hypothetical protein